MTSSGGGEDPEETEPAEESVSGIKLLILDTERLPDDDEESALGRPACVKSPKVFRGDIWYGDAVCAAAMREPEGFPSGLSRILIRTEGASELLPRL